VRFDGSNHPARVTVIGDQDSRADVSASTNSCKTVSAAYFPYFVPSTRAFALHLLCFDLLAVRDIFIILHVKAVRPFNREHDWRFLHQRLELLGDVVFRSEGQCLGAT